MPYHSRQASRDRHAAPIPAGPSAAAPIAMLLSRKRRASDAVAVAHERVRELTRTALHVAPSPSYLDRPRAAAERSVPLISERQREVVVKYVNEVRISPLFYCLTAWGARRNSPFRRNAPPNPPFLILRAARFFPCN